MYSDAPIPDVFIFGEPEAPQFAIFTMDRKRNGIKRTAGRVTIVIVPALKTTKVHFNSIYSKVVQSAAEQGDHLVILNSRHPSEGKEITSRVGLILPNANPVVIAADKVRLLSRLNQTLLSSWLSQKTSLSNYAVRIVGEHKTEALNTAVVAVSQAGIGDPRTAIWGIP